MNLLRPLALLALLLFSCSLSQAAELVQTPSLTAETRQQIIQQTVDEYHPCLDCLEVIEEGWMGTAYRIMAETFIRKDRFSDALNYYGLLAVSCGQPKIELACNEVSHVDQIFGGTVASGSSFC